MEKYTFAAETIEYLGMIVSHNQLSMDSAKLAGIRDWPILKDTKGVRKFLGYGNFYRKFI
ncbi:hypothetical protein SERLA73DRAFT_81408, partial [Serpula lacrymans var. lacrymans S7.3]